MSINFQSASTQYLEINSAIVSSFPLTIEVISMPTEDIDQSLFSITNSGTTNNMISMTLLDSGKGSHAQAFTRSSSGIQEIESSGAYILNTFHHFGAVFESNTTRHVYLDGDVDSEITGAITPAGLNRSSIARAGDASPSIYGGNNTYRVCIWDVVLTEGEMIALAKGEDPLNIKQADIQLLVYFEGNPQTPNYVIGSSFTAYNSPGSANDYNPTRYLLREDNPDALNNYITLQSPAASTDASLTIPRLKVGQGITYPSNIWVVPEGTEILFSNDYFNTDTNLSVSSMDRHVSMTIDNENNCHFVDRRAAGGVTYRRSQVSTTVEPFINPDYTIAIDDFAGTQGSCGGIVAIGDDIYFVVREVSGVNTNIWVHHSTDKGVTWQAPDNLGLFNGDHRSGMIVIDSQPAVTIWEEQGANPADLYLIRYNGAAWITDTNVITVESMNALTREITWIEDVDGRIHVVYWDENAGANVIRHQTKTNFAAAWSGATIVDTWEDNDLSPSLSIVGGIVHLNYRYLTRAVQREWTVSGGWSSRVDISQGVADHRYPTSAYEVNAISKVLPVIYTDGNDLVMALAEMPILGIPFGGIYGKALTGSLGGRGV